MAGKKPETLTPKGTRQRSPAGLEEKGKRLLTPTPKTKKGYAAAAVLSANWVGVGGLAKIVHIPGSYVSLGILVGLAVLSLRTAYLCWRS